MKSFRPYGQAADSIAAMNDGYAQGLVQMEALRSYFDELLEDIGE